MVVSASLCGTSQNRPFVGKVTRALIPRLAVNEVNLGRTASCTVATRPRRGDGGDGLCVGQRPTTVEARGWPSPLSPQADQP
jgi:hypothetical protein